MEELMLKDKTLLVVDDEADLREIVSSELEYMGARVFQAENVAAAKVLIESEAFDLVVSDIRMPGGTGIDLLNYIKAKSINVPPIILITGFADISAEAAFNQGAEALLSKPFKLEELIDVATKLTGPADQRFQLNDVKNYKKLHSKFDDSLSSLISRHECAIGRGGITLVAETLNTKWDVGEAISFHFTFLDTTLSGTAVCRWWKPSSDHQKATFGLEFIQLSDDSFEFLQNYWSNKAIIPFIPTLN